MDIPELIPIRKPGRYIGHEWNCVDKKISASMVKVCSCFPDTYELGMSTLGGRILYGFFNQFPDIFCDRAFLPGEDYQAYLHDHRKPLSGLQSEISLADFDLVGFTMNYELNYINFLNMLALAGIPLHAAGREKPIVAIGGIANPLPLAPFIDFCFMGEVEAVSDVFIDRLKELPRLSKKEFLSSIADLPGIYVPGMTQGKNVQRVCVKDLDRSYYPQQWLVPYVGIVHDRAYVEVSRGCPRQCGFCQARALYYPYRERSPERVIELVHQLYKNTGYEDISLLGLSVSDYSGIEAVLKEIIRSLGKYGVKISLPSLRATDLVGSLSSLISQIKKSGLTIAIETVSPKLRQIINKPIDHQQLFAALENACAAGYRKFKFYFMIGLPQEEIADLDAIVDFIKMVNAHIRRKTAAQINLTISHFIPKPFSKLEGVAMDQLPVLQQKTQYLYQQLKSFRNIDISVSTSTDSIVEAVLSRGDEQVGVILEYILARQKNFSQGRVDFPLWEEAFRAHGLDYGKYIFEKKENHCWDLFKSIKASEGHSVKE